MKLTINEVDYVLEPSDRGTWEIVYDSSHSAYRRLGNTGLMAVLEGWDGENTLSVFHTANQSGMQEFIVLENVVDGPMTWHRISTVGWNMDAEMDLKIQLTNLLNLLMADPLDRENDITCFPGYPQVTKNRVKAVQRMQKDTKDFREGRVEYAGVQTRQNFTLRHSK